MTTIQMNTRMDAAIKPDGDAALASIGYTPSGVVHAVWNFASRNRHNPKMLKKLRDLLEPAKADEAAIEPDWVEAGPLAYKCMLQEMGIEHEPASLQQSDEELLYQAHLDKMADREVRA